MTASRTRTPIKKSGVISAFTLGLAGTNLITPAVLANLDKTYGGPPEAQLTLCVATGTPTHPAYRVAAESAVVKLRSELGQVAEFPLMTPLPVVRGEILALTVPTWAPVLSFELNTTKFAYGQSRAQIKTSHDGDLELQHDRRRQPGPDRRWRALELQLHLSGHADRVLGARDHDARGLHRFDSQAQGGQAHGRQAQGRYALALIASSAGAGVSRRYHSASSAAWQPEPAAVIAWR